MEALIFVTAAVVAGAAVAYDQYLSPRARLRRALERAPRAAIRDAPDHAPVKIAGRLKSAGPLFKAPLSGRPCVGYHVIVREMQGNTPVTLIDTQLARDFTLQDDTGRALVRVSRLKLVLAPETFTVADELPEDVAEKFLESHAITARELTGRLRRLRYREAILEENTDVAVLGVGHWEYDPDPNAQGAMYRERPRRLVIDAPHGVTVIVSNETKLL